MRLRRLAHRVVTMPWVYEFVQLAVGARIVDRVVKRMIDHALEGRLTGLVVDIGGGTGRARRLWPARWSYICIDSDPAKAPMLRSRRKGDRWEIGDATHLPVQSGTCDAALIKFVAHHLSDDQLRATLGEAGRVVSPSGRLIFVDAVLVPSRLPSQALWRYDRGSEPRPVQALREAISATFVIEAAGEVRLFHRYVIFVCRRKGSVQATDRSDPGVTAGGTRGMGC